MLSFFPSPYPGEALYSIIARYHQRSGNSSFRQTAAELFGDKSTHSSVTLPMRLGNLAKQTVSFGLPFEKLLYAHTLYPYYTTFSGEETAAQIYDWAKESKSGPVDCRLGIYGTRAKQPKYLRFCPECFSGELEQYKEGFWHLLHQTPGVLVCDLHHCPLMETKVTYYTKGSNEYVKAVPGMLFPAVYPPPLSPLAQQQAIQIAGDIRYLYENYARARAAYKRYNGSFHKLFLRILQEKELASGGSMLRLEKYRSAFLTFFAPDLLDRLGLDFDKQVGRPWIISMCRSDRNDFHPLRYVLLARFLCNGLSEFITLAETYQPEKLVILPPQRKQVTGYEGKRKNYRSRWLKACEAMSGASQSEIRKTAEAVYTWLNRHDKEWLTQHPKERKPRGGNQTYADWAGKDYNFSRRVFNAVLKLRLRPGKPVQITKAKLLQEIGCGMLPSKQYARLPLTAKAIMLEVEDRQAFRMRKIQWAVWELTARGEPVVKWHVMKLAGIRDDAWETCWEAYQSQEKHP